MTHRGPSTGRAAVSWTRPATSGSSRCCLLHRPSPRGCGADDVVRAVDGAPHRGPHHRRCRGPRSAGPATARSRLSLERAGETLELAIKRDVIVSQDVRSALLADGQVGYLRVDALQQQRRRTTSRRPCASISTRASSGLVIDVRDDPGGFVDAAVDIASEFLPDGPVYWEEIGRRGAACHRGERRAAWPSTRPSRSSCSSTMAPRRRARSWPGRSRTPDAPSSWASPASARARCRSGPSCPGESGGFRLSIARWLTRDKHWVDERGLQPDVEVADAGSRYWPEVDRAVPDRRRCGGRPPAHGGHRSARRRARWPRPPRRVDLPGSQRQRPTMLLSRVRLDAGELSGSGRARPCGSTPRMRLVFSASERRWCAMQDHLSSCTASEVRR